MKYLKKINSILKVNTFPFWLGIMTIIGYRIADMQDTPEFSTFVWIYHIVVELMWLVYAITRERGLIIMVVANLIIFTVNLIK